MKTTDTIKALANERRMMILDWLKDPRAHFAPQVDGDLVDAVDVLPARRGVHPRRQGRSPGQFVNGVAQFGPLAAAACWAVLLCATMASSRAMFSSRRWLVRIRK